tara:strand:+ start:268 stop:1296 length:1029 start_codon:yes stop_codon:yes gene_type:complete
MGYTNNEETNKQVFLKKIPSGIATPDDFEVKETKIPKIESGQVLVQAHYLTVDAALRLIVRDSDDFLFRVRPGDLVNNTFAGRIIESNNPEFKVDEYVLAPLGVQNYGISDGQELEKVNLNLAPLSSWLGGFGTSGLTAYFAMLDECRPQPGQTVLINGAAGAVGTMAGQFAKLTGATVIGITSSDQKCDWLVEEIGYDIAINYNNPDWVQELETAAPNRLDVIFDNVGGSILNESLRFIGMRGIVLLCGSTSQYTEESMTGPNNYIWLGTMRARMQGFVIFDYVEQYETARSNMAKWIEQGKLKLPEHIIDGDIEAFPSAFQGLYMGENLGKMLIRLPVAQ